MLFVVLSLKDTSLFLRCIPASASDAAAAVNPSVIKKLLANRLRIFFMEGKPVFRNCPRGLSKNPLNCMMLDS